MGAVDWIEGGDLLAVEGWRAAAVRSGVKPSGGLDLALFVADEVQNAAAVFTRNQLPAAPVVLGREDLARRSRLRTVVVNAGNANAITGEKGLEDARSMRDRAASRCGGPALVLSTGVIGVPLPIERILAGIDDAATALERSCPGAADAILTTDTCRKVRAGTLELEGGRVTIGGVAKGSGMIHPNMATMLAIVALDTPVPADALQGMLKRSVDESFHRITVDGDTSTNDTVVLLAPRPCAETARNDERRLEEVEAGLRQVLLALALDIVRDGEGRSRVLEVRVDGARDRDDARKVASSIARSSLVKTALAGGDPNWGRIVAAAANAGVELPRGVQAVRIGDVRVLQDGRPTSFDAQAAGAAFSRDEVRVELSLGAGAGEARMWTTDLTHDYVRINSEYAT